MESTGVILAWFGEANYWLMEWANDYWWQVLSAMILVGSLIGMSPLMTHHEHSFRQVILVKIRQIILWLGIIILCLPPVMLYIYDMTMMNQLGDSQSVWLDWFIGLAKDNWHYTAVAAFTGLTTRFMLYRYGQPLWSAILKKLRVTQSDDAPTDIRLEAERLKPKDFLPAKYYKPEHIVVGVGEDNKPLTVPADTWYETNMQIIGPTRYGKGVIIGALLDQGIRRGDTMFYIDPKSDTFAPAIMYQAAKETGRKFYYLTLHDNGPGKWSPFAGGSGPDAYARLETALGLQLTGDPGTDFYKTQEAQAIRRAFEKTRSIPGIRHEIENTDALRAKAELEKWSSIETFCPKKGAGFTIEKALKENAVVYVQGGLDDGTVLSATKLFITELVQETRRLKEERTTHMTCIVDETSFLASQVLAQALATIVGFRANFVLAYQSQKDLLNLSDKTVNGDYVHQSINVNCQLKAVYGGADFETAEWIANLSGTISKEVAKMEKTNISATGGETWENERSIGHIEENLISTNVVMTLPKRVCVLIRPNMLGAVCFTSFVPIKDTAALPLYLSVLTQATPPDAGELNVTAANESALISQEKISKTPKTANILPFQKQPKLDSPLLTTEPKKVSEKGDKIKSYDYDSTLPEMTTSKKVGSSHKTSEQPAEATQNVSHAKLAEEAEKKRAQNRARKAKQKKKRAMANNPESPFSKTTQVEHKPKS